MTYVKQRKGWRMSYDVSKATERLENELWPRWSRFTYVIAHSPILPLLHIRHSSFSNHYFASPTSQVLHLCHLASHPWITNLFYMGKCSRRFFLAFSTLFLYSQISPLAFVGCFKNKDRATNSEISPPDVLIKKFILQTPEGKNRQSRKRGRPRWSSGYHTCHWIRGPWVQIRPGSMDFFRV